MSLQRLADDPELGAVRYCPRCAEWWPDDGEFWYYDAHSNRTWCRACQDERSRERHELRLSKRARGLCMVPACPVQTPRMYCEFHVRSRS